MADVPQDEMQYACFHFLPLVSLPRNPGPQWLVISVAVDAKQREEWTFLRLREPQKQ